MDIHEYQAKELLAGFGVPVPRGGLAYSPEQAGYRARELGGSAWVVKAQIHSGGRGAAPHRKWFTRRSVPARRTRPADGRAPADRRAASER